jgi:tetratricopeptide (TPR) repeat protein
MAKFAPVEEPIESPVETIIAWAQANARKISIIGMVVVLAAAIGMLWRASAEKKQVRASQALAAAQAVAQSGNAALAQSDLRALLRRYGGTKAAVQARILLAQVLYTQEKFEEGLKELEATSPSGPSAASYYGLKAAGLEQTGKLAEAATEYERAASAAETVLAKASYRSDAARAYLAAGNKDAALKIWEGLAADDASPLAGEAKIRIGELTARPIG